MPGSVKLLTPSERRRLTISSHEEHIARVASAVRAQFEGVQHSIVSTFDDGAIVMSEGHTYRVQVVSVEDGTVLAEDMTEIETQVVTEGTVVRDALGVVDMFLRGDAVSARARLGEFASTVPKLDGPDEGSVCDLFEGAVRIERPWRTTLVENKVEIQAILQNNRTPLDGDRLHTKFSELYHEAVEGTHRESLVTLLDGTLEVVMVKWGQVQEAVESSLCRIQTALLGKPDAADVLEGLDDFASHLLDDVRDVRSYAERVLGNSTDPGLRGRLCDLLAEGLYDRQVAGRFIVVVADRLAETAT